MIVGGSQRVDVALAQSSWIAKAASTPGKSSSTKLHNKKIGYEAGMSAIAIVKGMYLHEPMVKP